jgi:hypothetical protein
MPVVKFYATVEANEISFYKGRLNFKDKLCKLVASYPSKYTIIEQVIEP